MSDEQPTQPLTDAELSALRDYIERTNHVDNLRGDARRLLAEVDRLRAERDFNAAVFMAHRDAFYRLQIERDDLASRLDVREVINQTIGELQTELEQLRAEATGIALGHLAKIERLQSERDALVRKLGLDWGPDEFGDLDAVPDVAKLQDEIEDYRQNV